MPRLFTALEIPRDAALSLSLLRGGLPGARWIDVENYHITLRFIGDVEGHVADEVANALDRVRRPSFSIGLSGVGAFGSKKPHAVWAGVTASPDLAALQGEIERICQRIGIPSDPRKFTPHVTLARLRNSQPDRRRRLSFGARQFLGGALPGRALRADVVARFGRRRALCGRGSLAARWPRHALQPVGQPLRRLADHAVDAGEAIAAAEIGIGHLGRPVGGEIQEQVDAVLEALGRHRPEVLDIGAVHAEDQVEAAEVGRDDAARLLGGDVDAVAGSDGDRARIGCRAEMPAARSGRVDQVGACRAAFGNDGAKHALGQRRTADVAEADEKNAAVGLCGHVWGAMVGHSVAISREGAMAREKLDEAAVADALSVLDGWALSRDGAAITRTFVFKNFSEAFGFMTRCALAAEKLDHHPEWSNVYKTVEVTLTTHDAGGLTELDFDLARKMDRFAAA